LTAWINGRKGCSALHASYVMISAFRAGHRGRRIVQ
jgi:hypothetical protein